MTEISVSIQVSPRLFVHLIDRVAEDPLTFVTAELLEGAAVRCEILPDCLEYCREGGAAVWTAGEAA